MQRGKDDGMSLIEVMISMIIFGTIMAVVVTALITSMTQAKDAVARADTVQSARLAIAQIDSQVRSGSVIQDPLDEPETNADVERGYSVRILTERGGEDACAQWRVKFDPDGAGELQFRSWPAFTPDDATGWTMVADSLIRPVEPFDTSDPTTFRPSELVLPADGASSMRGLQITFRVRNENSVDYAKPTLVSTTVTGRNTVFGRAGLECADVPDA